MLGLDCCFDDIGFMQTPWFGNLGSFRLLIVCTPTREGVASKKGTKWNWSPAALAWLAVGCICFGQA